MNSSPKVQFYKAFIALEPMSLTLRDVRLHGLRRLIPPRKRQSFVRRSQASISMWIGAWQARAKFTFLAGFRTASGTPYRQRLLLGYFHTHVVHAYLHLHVGQS